MNGSRSHPSRPAGSSSLDALSRTIEGLEARIEGLIGSTARDARPLDEQRRELLRSPPADRDPRPAADGRFDPLAEIRQRQRALEASRARPLSDSPLPSAPLPTPAPAPRAQAPATPPVANPAPDMMAREITQALMSLRLELKKDISEGLAREVDTLRSEIRSIRSLVEERPQGDDMRQDLARLADGINQLGNQAAPGTDTLKAEFEDLRSLMDGLARDDTVRQIENRWDNLESKLDGLDTATLQGDLVSLADRLDDIKGQLGSIGDNRAIRALEDKLIAVATALEQIGTHIDPGERGMSDQFAGIDMRLDEISRAITAGNRSHAPSADNAMLTRLESRIAGIADQIDILSDHSARPDDHASAELGLRIESLTQRIEELSSERAAGRLEERLDQLSVLLERSQRPVPQPELTGYLADISRKIDALDQGAINDPLAERLDELARRIEDLHLPQPLMAPADDTLLRGLENRLNFVVERLEETARAPADDMSSLRGLEEQIAHLSALISAAPADNSAAGGQFSGRMSALEDYMATSDEYIIEAARHAAEAVMESYSQNGAPQSAGTSRDVETLAALAGNLKHLEDISRGSEERTHKTFEALHETLMQIAERLDGMEMAAPATRQTSAAPAEMATTEPAPLFAMADADPFAQDTVWARQIEEAYPKRTPAPEPVAAPSSTATSQVDADLDRAPQRIEKPSLLAGLGKRLMPGQKKQEPAARSRTLIDPTPSIDPIDAMPAEEANELLEPGSGAPDVRRILERVRASQAAKQQTDGDLPPMSDADRTDYIAAARRAAQAAAQEVDRTQKSPAPKPLGEKASASALTRYRRPILMAVGAVLLAAMAMPLVNTLIRSDAPPEVIEEAAPAAEPLTLAPPEALPEAAVTPETATAPTDTGTDTGTGTGAGTQADSTDALTDQKPLDGDQIPDTLLPAGAQSDVPAAASSFAPVETATPPAAAAIDIPAAITPPSLVNAAKAGDPLALFEIGDRFTEGRGVAKDLGEASKWYRLSADKGFAPAQYRLANLLEKGNGVERDIDAARGYYQQAADSGNASAMHNLAVLYASGNGSTQNYEKAAEWFAKAAELGVSDSQFNLAILYARGNGVQPNLETSYKWFAIAAKNGDADAAQKRDEVANAMKPEQLAKARADVELWKATPLNADANSIEAPDEWAGKGVKTASVDMKRAIGNIQAILKKTGFDVGTPDGIMGAKTVAAIKAFQTSIGQKPTGQIDDALVTELLARNK
ncbi:MAG: peptidoglycan-binding protein [Allorhizobium sp.]